MKRLAVAVIIVLFASPAPAGWFGTWKEPAAFDQVAVEATFAPPHNEPVLPGALLIGRYRASLDVEGHWRVFGAELTLNAWGMNEWRPPSVVGHGVPEAWKNSDFGIDAIRMQYILRTTVDLYTWQDSAIQVLGEFQEWNEAYRPAKDYWTLVGIRAVWRPRR